MRKEDNSPQGKIVTELLQHLHACKNNCDVFFGREDELEKMKEYITGPSQKVTIQNGLVHPNLWKQVLRRRNVSKSAPKSGNEQSNMLTIYFVQPFVLYGNGGAGKSALLSKSALQSLKVEEMFK